MPARRGGQKQQHGGSGDGAATLVRSDQDSGMALVKSKDGRTKWLTVSTDPASTPPSTTWDERVRTWASMLGVCAPPPPSPSTADKGGEGKQGRTPLPTPPPGAAAWGYEEAGGEAAEGEEQGQQEEARRYPPGQRDSGSDVAPAAAAAAAVAAVGAAGAPGEPSGAGSGTAAPAAAAAAAASPATVASTARRKNMGAGKRVASFSFARGFLLGLGGGGGSGGGGDDADAKRSKSSSVGFGAGGDADAAPAAAAGASGPETLPRPAGGSVVDEDTELGEQHDTEADMPVLASPGAGTRSGRGEDGGGGGGRAVGRMRWVKGATAPPSPSDSSDNACSYSDEDSDGDRLVRHTGDGKEGGSTNAVGADGGGGRIGCGGGSGAPIAAAAAGAGAADVATPTSLSIEDLEWLDVSPGGSNTPRGMKSNGGENGGGTKASAGTGGGGGGGGGGGSSKKKKKNKGKGNGGGGGGGGGAKTNPKKQELQQGTPTAAAAAMTTSADQDGAKSKAASKASAKAKRNKPAASVAFGDVNLLEFTRDVGGCGVPGDGTWGLSLGMLFRETVVDVDGYEASKTEILEERMSELSRKQRHLSTGETRQFDYRPVGERNPLFFRLDEKERSKKLLDYACFHKGDLEEADKDKDCAERRTSVGSGGKNTSEFDAYTHKVSHSEFVDKSQEASVELTALRDSRKKSQGCSCSCVRADKLNLAKLRAELGKRGLKPSGSKKDLVKMLQEAMRQEEEANGGKAVKACRTEECQCVIDGVECHADLCNCCKGPSIGVKDAHHGGNCGNPEGVYAYSSSVVRSHREPYITAKVVPGRERGGGHGRSDSVCSDHH